MKRLIALTVLSLLTVTLMACSGSPKKGEIPVPEGPKITVKGKISYTNTLGGYFVLGLEPGGELFIENKDPRILEALYKSGKIVIIEGRIVRGAEYLFIEKIDGKEYPGKLEPAPK